MIGPKIREAYNAISTNKIYKLNLSDVVIGPTVTKTSLEFSAGRGQSTISLECNVAWTVNTSMNWVSTNLSSGNGNQQLTITCLPNKTGAIRGAYVYIQSSQGRVEISISQDFRLYDWQEKYFFDETFNMVNFVTDDIGFIGGKSYVQPAVFTTNNRGLSWQDVSPSAVGEIYDMEFISPLLGWIITSDPLHPIMKTINGGLSWTDMQSLPVNSYSKIYIKSETEIFVKSSAGFYHTTNGSTWKLHPNLNNNVTSMFFQGNLRFASTFDGKIYNSLDGTTWNEIGKATANSIEGLHFISELKGYACGNGFLVTTENGGVSWSLLQSNFSDFHLTSIEVAGNHNIFFGRNFISNDGGISLKRLSGITGLPGEVSATNQGAFSVSGNKIYYIDLSTYKIGPRVSQEFHTFPAEGGKLTITVTFEGSWAISIDRSWATVNPISGTGNGAITITCPPVENPQNSMVVTLSGDDGGINIITLILENEPYDWKPISTLGRTTLNSICFVNDYLGFTGGNGATTPSLWRTNDGGNSWVDISPNFLGNIYDIAFRSSTEGLMLTSTNGVMQTKDSGATWTPVSTGFSTDANNKICFKGTQETYIYGGYESNYSGDGSNWIKIPTLKYISRLLFTSEQIGYASNLQGEIYKTVDGGLNWNFWLHASANPIRDLYFINDTIGYATGDRFLIYTQDGGLTWTELNTHSIQFVEQKMDLVLGKIFINGTIGSHDNGKTLTPITGVCCVKDQFFTSQFGYAIQNNVVYKLIVTNVLSIEGKSNIVSSLKMNIIPNPSSNETTILFSKGASNLEIIDLQGEVHFSTNLNQSDERCLVNTEKIPRGLYFVRVSSPKQFETQKLVLY